MKTVPMRWFDLDAPIQEIRATLGADPRLAELLASHPGIRVPGAWVLPMPERLDARRAMALGTAGLTAGLALRALLDRGLTPERGPVLVTGASGGVGSATVQLAKRRGARVAAITGKAKMQQVRGLGADIIVERGADPVEALGDSSVDVVVDNVAGPAFPQMLKVLRRGGRYVSSGAIAGPIVELDLRTFYLRDLTFTGSTVVPPGTLATVVRYIEAGDIRPALAATYPLHEFHAAQTAFIEKRHTGNIVVIP